MAPPVRQQDISRRTRCGACFGELWVLSLLAKQNPFFALDSWRGPRGDAHDFIAPRGQLEVKSSKREGLDVTISSLAQLDRAHRTSLGLVRLHSTPPLMDRAFDDMVEKLTGMGMPRATVIESIGGNGFPRGSRRRRFSIHRSTSPTRLACHGRLPGSALHGLAGRPREAITQSVFLEPQ
ncbi:PD-(D/E)XK motif protein [Propionibacterium freudenreichii]|nr:PD-(D/E)XK motif protein [Propionibacterium freudenreichii]